MGKQSALRKMTISNLALLYEGRGKRIEELEAQIKHKDEVMLKQTKLNTRVINEKMALRDGLRGLAEKWHDPHDWPEVTPRHLRRLKGQMEASTECARELLALLGKEKNDE